MHSYTVKQLLCLSLGLVYLLSPLAAQARTRDNSSRVRPGGLNVGNVNGDELHDWIGVRRVDDGYWQTVQVYLGSNANFFIDSMNGGGFSVYGGSSVYYPLYTFVGRFKNSTKDDICVYTSVYTYGPGGGLTPQINCFEHSGSWGLYEFGSGAGGDMVWKMPAEIHAANEYRGFAVGDFDGDGRDDIMTYYRNNGTNVRVWSYDPTTARFVINSRIDLGALSQHYWAGTVDAFAGEFYQGAGARRDDVIFYNRSTGHVERFSSMVNFWGNPTFGGRVQSPYAQWPNDQISVANADGDAFDDLIVVDTTNGWVRFLNLSGTSTFFTSVNNMERGNLPYPSGQGIHHLWAPRGSPRDDVFAVMADGQIHSYYPHDLSNGVKTYYWRGSYNVPYIHSRIGM